jgi:hypothetical protein
VRPAVKLQAHGHILNGQPIDKVVCSALNMKQTVNDPSESDILLYCPIVGTSWLLAALCCGRSPIVAARGGVLIKLTA